MKGFSVFVVLCSMAMVLHLGVIATPYFEDKDISSDFRGDVTNSLRSRVGLRDNNYRDFNFKSRFEDVLESPGETPLKCRWCRLIFDAKKCRPNCP